MKKHSLNDWLLAKLSHLPKYSWNSGGNLTEDHIYYKRLNFTMLVAIRHLGNKQSKLHFCLQYSLDYYLSRLLRNEYNGSSEIIAMNQLAIIAKESKFINLYHLKWSDIVDKGAPARLHPLHEKVESTDVDNNCRPISLLRFTCTHSFTRLYFIENNNDFIRT